VQAGAARVAHQLERFELIEERAPRYRGIGLLD
jgi:hypothetical protein